MEGQFIQSISPSILCWLSRLPIRCYRYLRCRLALLLFFLFCCTFHPRADLTLPHSHQPPPPPLIACWCLCVAPNLLSPSSPRPSHPLTPICLQRVWDSFRFISLGLRFTRACSAYSLIPFNHSVLFLLSSVIPHPPTPPPPLDPLHPPTSSRHRSFDYTCDAGFAASLPRIDNSNNTYCRARSLSTHYRRAR